MAHSLAEAGVPNRYLPLPAFAHLDGHNGRMRYLIALIVGIVALFVVNAFTGVFSLPRPWNSLSMGGIVGVTMVIILLIWETVRPSQREGIPGVPKMSEEERAQARADRRARLAAEAGVRDEGSPESARSSLTSSEASDASASGEASDAAETSSPASATHAPPTGAEKSSVESVASGDDDKPSAESAPGDDDKPSAGSDRSSSAADPSRTTPESPRTAAPPVPEARLGEVGDDAVSTDASSTEQAADTATKRAADAKEAERAEADAQSVDDVEPDHAREAAERRQEYEDSAVTDDNRDDSAQGSSLESPPVGQPGVSLDVLDDERDVSDAESSDDQADGDTRTAR